MTHWSSIADGVDQVQTAQTCSLILDLHHPPHDTNFLPKSASKATRIKLFNSSIVESVYLAATDLTEKEKALVAGIFSFSHIVFSNVFFFSVVQVRNCFDERY